MICRVCKAALIRWGATGGIPLLKCVVCGSIHADCAKPAEDLYADIYSRETGVSTVVAASLDAVVRSMGPFRTHGRWLDIGFGQGALLDAAARGEWLCHGTEVSSVAIDKGRARGFVTATSAETFETGSFDVVSLVELVEHVENPALFLTEARRVLRKGGGLYLTTPNAWSLNRWVLGPRWTVFAPPDHLTIFTPPALRGALANAGFQVTQLRTEGLNPFEILRFFKRENGGDFHRTNAGEGLNASMSTTPGRRGLKASLNAFLSATRLGDSLKARST